MPGGVYKTTDGGFTWEEKNNGLTNFDWDINTIIINPKKPGELYIGTGSAQTDFLFKTTNGGEKWFNFSNGLPDSGGVISIVIDTLNERIYLGVGAGAVNGSGIYIYDGLSSVNNDKEVPVNFYLYQNYPNPFNPSTKIKFEIPTSSVITLKVYDVLGREIETLLNEVKEAGTYEVELNASEFPSGVYFYKLTSGQFTSVKKLILLK